ncbi:hypothetical protein KEM52_003038, partial [Ascosphaera acerosa]
MKSKTGWDGKLRVRAPANPGGAAGRVGADDADMSVDEATDGARSVEDTSASEQEEGEEDDKKDDSSTPPPPRAARAVTTVTTATTVSAPPDQPQRAVECTSEAAGETHETGTTPRAHARLLNPEVLADPARATAADALPPEQVEADEDLLADEDSDVEELDLVHSRVQSMAALRLERFARLERLGLRQNEIARIAVPDAVAPRLVELDLYDNRIAHMRGLERMANLASLDLSFNNIKHIRGVAHMRKLRDLYFVQNLIKRIENLEGLEALRNLELAANKIREIENLEGLQALEELWLGKNKITEIRNVSCLHRLKILSLPSNRLTKISGLQGLTALEELYVSHNAITELSGLDDNANLRVLDVTANKIARLQNISHLHRLEEFWASDNLLASFDELDRELRDKKELKTVYFEGNPLQTRQPVLYRNKVRLALPQLQQIDATFAAGCAAGTTSARSPPRRARAA